MITQFEVTVSGPMFDARGDARRDVFVQRLVNTVSREAKNRTVGNMAMAFRNPTPFYWTQITTEPVRPFVDRVWDQNTVVYGPWLEGVSERNRTTRFKGYASFRRATQATAAVVPQIAQEPIRDYIKDMNR